MAVRDIRVWMAPALDLLDSSPVRRQESLDSHGLLLDCLRQGDRAGAGEAMRAHIAVTEHAVAAALSAQGRPPTGYGMSRPVAGRAARPLRPAPPSGTREDGFMANVEATDIPADSGAPGPADVLKRIQAENIRDVRPALTDLHRLFRGKVVTAQRIERPWTRRSLRNRCSRRISGSGTHQASTSTATISATGTGFCAPIPSPTRRCRGRPAPRICSRTCTTPTASCSKTPRAVLRRVLDYARGLGLQPVFGHELEFYVFRPDPDQQGYAPIYGPQSWFSVHALGLAQRFIDELDHAIAVMGLPVYEIFSEHGAGQFEINSSPGPACWPPTALSR